MRRMLVATALCAAIATGYSSGAAAQQSRNDLRHHDEAAPYPQQDDETPESRPETQRPQPPGGVALVSKSRDSGLAQTLDPSTISMLIERVPRPVDADDASRFIGLLAVSRRGEKVGEVLAVVRSPTAELLALVDPSDFLGVEVRPVALPIAPGGTDRNGNVRLLASREELEKLPVFTASLDR